VYVVCTPYSETSITDSLTDDHVDARLCRHIPASSIRQREDAERWLYGVCSATSGSHLGCIPRPRGCQTDGIRNKTGAMA
jgi:hypothetical protein